MDGLLIYTYIRGNEFVPEGCPSYNYEIHFVGSSWDHRQPRGGGGMGIYVDKELLQRRMYHLHGFKTQPKQTYILNMR